ncbi:MAG: DUF952 domain-containing protein [Ferruginibacter sp.]|nr:DUF952 domain-containing protein [Ferruginibacter sp.]
MIYHVTRKSDWEKALSNGFYEAASLRTEGFIHASSVTQITGVLERYYENEKELLLLHIDEQLLTSPLKYEIASSVDQVFPHVFGAINLDAVVKTAEI